MSVANNRVSAGGRTVENDPKSATSRRTLPPPDRLVSVLKAPRRRQAVPTSVRLTRFATPLIAHRCDLSAPVEP